MLISESNNFCFIHNPKCAGTTVRNSLRVLCDNDNFWMFDDLYGRKVDKAHLPAVFFERLYPDDYKRVESLFTFGFVRNPYSRLISAYNEIHKSNYKALIEEKVTVDEYKLGLNDYINKASPKLITSEHLKYRHTVPQVNMFYNKSKCIADLIIKLEDINSSPEKIRPFNTVVADISKTWCTRKNNEKKISYRPEDLLSHSSIDKIGYLFEDDFHVFGYEFL